MSLAGKTAVVTGGGRGIGAAVALALARAGSDVLVASRSKASVDATAARLRELGVRAFSAVLDVADPASIAALGREAEQMLGKVDILVNNAGIASSAPIKKLMLEEWDRILKVNATGVFLCTQAFIGGMATRKWGRIVNVASIAARSGAPYIAAYAASKHAVLGFTRVAAAEYADKNVTINAVCPGYVDTDMTTESVSGVAARSGLDRQAALEAILKTARQSRLVTPEEVAHVVLSLCAEESAGVNGQAIVIDGGGLLA
jgi:NAD(P)-dependent dehydrogenase (short-subunit alcohol dehydrogenase family)